MCGNISTQKLKVSRWLSMTLDASFFYQSFSRLYPVDVGILPLLPSVNIWAFGLQGTSMSLSARIRLWLGDKFVKPTFISKKSLVQHVHESFKVFQRGIAMKLEFHWSVRTSNSYDRRLYQLQQPKASSSWTPNSLSDKSESFLQRFWKDILARILRVLAMQRKTSSFFLQEGRNDLRVLNQQKKACRLQSDKGCGPCLVQYGKVNALYSDVVTSEQFQAISKAEFSRRIFDTQSCLKQMFDQALGLQWISSKTYHFCLDPILGVDLDRVEQTAGTIRFMPKIPSLM